MATLSLPLHDGRSMIKKLFKPVIGYKGWTGYGNLGDEALYEILAELVKPCRLREYRIYYGRGKMLTAWQERIFSGFIMGGGTLINSANYLTTIRHLLDGQFPLFAFGSGVLDPAFCEEYLGYLGYGNHLEPWVEALGRFNLVGIRGPRSDKLLAAHGLTGHTVVGDPVLSFADDELQARARTGVIGVNYGTTRDGKCLYGGSDEAVYEQMVSLCRELQKMGWELVLFPVYSQDVLASERLAAALPKKPGIWPHNVDMRQFMAAVRDVDLFVGEKLHSVIGAIAAQVPSIMIAYQPKCYDFMESIEMESYTIRTDEIEIDAILGMLDTLAHSLAESRLMIHQKVLYWKQEQQRFARKIIDIIRGS